MPWVPAENQEVTPEETTPKRGRWVRELEEPQSVKNVTIPIPGVVGIGLEQEVPENWYKWPHIQATIARNKDIDLALQISRGDWEWSLKQAEGISPEVAREVLQLARLRKMDGVKDKAFLQRHLAEMKNIEKSSLLLKRLAEVNPDGSPRFPVAQKILKDPYALAAVKDNIDAYLKLEGLEVERHGGLTQHAFYGLTGGVKSGLNAVLGVTKSLLELGSGEPGAGPQRQGGRPGAGPKVIDRMIHSDILKATPVPTGGFLGFVRDVYAFIPQLGATLSGLYLGGPTAGGAVMGAWIQGNTYNELRDQGVSPERAFWTATANGVIQGLMERIPLGAWSELFDSTGKPWRAALIQAAKVTATEGGIEWAQQYPDALTRIIGEEELRGGSLAMQLKRSVDRFVEEFPEITKEGIYEGLVGATMGALVGGATSVGNSARQALIEKEIYDTLDEAQAFVEEMKQDGAPPELHKAYVRAKFKDSVAQNIYLDPDKIREYYQLPEDEGGGIDEKRMQEDMTALGVWEQLKQSDVTGEKVKLPYENWAVDVASTDFGKYMRDHTALSPDGLTVFEHSEEAKQIQAKKHTEWVAEAIDNYKRMVNDNRLPDELRAMRDTLVAKPEEGGVGLKASDADAKMSLFTSMAEVAARRSGVSLREWARITQPRLEVQSGEPVFLYNGAALFQSAAVHGSPYTFEQFKLDAIGTGEGAQAFGHGLYFSESEEVGKYYATALSQVTIDGVPVAEYWQSRSHLNNVHTLLKYMREQSGNNSLTIEDASKEWDATEEERLIRDIAAEIDSRGLKYAVTGSYNRKLAPLFQRLKAEGRIQQNPRNLYRVTLWPNKDEVLLDWHEPLDSEMADAIAHQFEVEKPEGIDWEFFAKDFRRPSTEPGKAAYRDLVEALGSQEAASHFLLRAGIDGIRYKAGTLSGVDSDAYNYVVFDDSQIRIDAHEQFQTGAVEPRGAIQFTDEAAIIKLFRTADLSTFLHEAAHLFVNELITYVETNTADARTIADYQTLKEYAGGEFTTEGLEKIARAFEVYLREGNAPSVRLIDAFRRFKAWLKALYQHVSRLNAPINEDLRNVFDRMVATEEHIAEYEYLAKNEQWLSEIAGKLDPRARLELQEARRQAKEQSREKLLSRFLKAFWSAVGNKKGVQQQAERDVDNTPLYKSINEITEAGGLDATQLPPESAKKLKKHGKSFVKKSGKMSPTDAARVYGYPDVETMVETLSDAPKRREAIKTRYNALVSEAEARALQDFEVGLSYPNEGRLRELIADLNALSSIISKSTNKRVPKTSASALRAQARRALADMRIRDAAALKRWLRNADSFGKKAIEAAKRGDLEQAMEFREKQALHIALAIEASEIAAAYEKAIKSWKNRAIEKRIAKLSTPYEEAVLELVSFWRLNSSESMRQPRSENALAELREYIQENETLSPDLYGTIPAFIRDRARPEGYMSPKDLTVEQFEQMRDTVNELITRGRGDRMRIKSMYAANEAEMVAAVVERLQQRPKKDPYTDENKRNRVMAGISWALNYLKKAEFIADMADGSPGLRGEAYGPIRELVVAVIEQEARKGALKEDIAAKLKPQFKVLLQEEARWAKKFGGKNFIPEGFVMPEALLTRHKKARTKLSFNMALAMMLNSGNAFNREVLLRGYNMSDAQLRLVQSHFSPEALQAVQEIWDTINELFPELDEVMWRQTGKRLIKEEAAEQTITLIDGTEVTLEGGYYPMVHDPLLDPNAGKYSEKDFAEKINEQIINGVHRLHRMEKGPTIARLRDKDGNPLAVKPVLLDASVMMQHIETALHIITHSEILATVNRVLRNEEVRKNFRERMGSDAYDEMLKWANRQASPDTVSPDPWSKGMESMKKLATLSILGGRIRTGLKQRLSLFDAIRAMGDSGPGAYKYLIQGFKQAGLSQSLIGKTFGEQVDFVYELSEYMRLRAKSAGDRELRDIRNRLDPLTKTYTIPKVGDVTKIDIQNFFFEWIKMNDSATVIPIWYGAYNQALSENIAGVKPDMDYETRQRLAIRYADGIVRTTQPSSLRADMSSLQANKRAVVHFYSSFMTYQAVRGNRLMQQLGAFKAGEISGKQLTKHIVWEFIGPKYLAASLALIAYASDDDEPNVYDWLFGPLEEMMAWLPILRDVGGAFKYRRDIGEAPAFEGANKAISAAKRGVKIGKKLIDGEDVESWADFLVESWQSFEFWAGLPVSNVFLDAYKETNKILAED